MKAHFSRHRIGIAAVVVVLCTAGALHALSIPFFIQGTLHDYGPLHDTVNVEIYELTLAHGESSGWHKHPGPAFVIVGQGALEEDHGCGSIVQRPSGSAFQEQTGEVHNVTNRGSEVAKLFVMQIVPLNTPDYTNVNPPACQ